MARISQSEKAAFFSRAIRGDTVAQFLLDLDDTKSRSYSVLGGVSAAASGGVAEVTLQVFSEGGTSPLLGADVFVELVSQSDGDGIFGDVLDGTSVVVENTSGKFHKGWYKTAATGLGKLRFNIEDAHAEAVLVMARSGGQSVLSGAALTAMFTVQF